MVKQKCRYFAIYDEDIWKIDVIQECLGILSGETEVPNFSPLGKPSKKKKSFFSDFSKPPCTPPPPPSSLDPYSGEFFFNCLKYPLMPETDFECKLKSVLEL